MPRRGSANRGHEFITTTFQGSWTRIPSPHVTDCRGESQRGPPTPNSAQWVPPIRLDLAKTPSRFGRRPQNKMIRGLQFLQVMPMHEPPGRHPPGQVTNYSASNPATAGPRGGGYWRPAPRPWLAEYQPPPASSSHHQPVPVTTSHYQPRPKYPKVPQNTPKHLNFTPKLLLGHKRKTNFDASSMNKK